MGRAARGLVAIIRRDARRLSGGRRTGALVSARSGRTRALRVYYRSPPFSYLPWHGAYELTLTSASDRLGAVSVAYFPTPAGWTYGAPGQAEGPSYSFTITAPGRRRGWSFTAMDSFLGCPGPSVPRGVCEGSSQAIGFDEAQGHAREFSRLYRQAVVVAQKAERHEPISGEDLFPAR